MLTNICTVLLLAASVTAKQENYKTPSSKDQDSASDQVTSILVQPGPDGPRHVILSDEHQILSSGGEGFSNRAIDNFHFPSANYVPRVEDLEYRHTVPPPLSHVTYGPARPVALRNRRPPQLYHHRFGTSPARVGGKISHLKGAKEDPKQLSEAIYKYSTYIKHDKIKEPAGDEENEYSNNEQEKPDYTVTAGGRETYRPKPQHEGLSAYRTHDDEEAKFRESIGDLYNPNNFEKDNDYSAEKKPNPLPYSKLHFTKQHNYIPENIDGNKYYAPVKNYNSYNSFDGAPHHDKPSGFDDMNGGKVAPVLAKFYKQPLPIIHTQLPADNLGLYIQYYRPKASHQEREELTNNFYEQFPQDHASHSEWTPINAPVGAVPAKSYDIPAPDLSLGKVIPGKVYRRGSDSSTVIVGKNKQSPLSNQHIRGNSEGVVSAVVRVKQ